MTRPQLDFALQTHSEQPLFIVSKGDDDGTLAVEYRGRDSGFRLACVAVEEVLDLFETVMQLTGDDLAMTVEEERGTVD